MYNTSFVKKFLLVATVVFFSSCDKDFNAIGDNLIGDDHFGLEPEQYDVVAYNQGVTAVQSNGLPINALGIYDNPVLGETTANFNTQVSLEAYAPIIGDAPVIQSVVLSVPYYSHVKVANSDGSSTYELDSIYGAPDGKLKLSVYESGVQMRSSYFDNGSQLAQLYYTDEDATFDKFKKVVDETTQDPLNNDPRESQNKKFFFDATQQVDSVVDATTKKVTVTRVAPEMRLNLDKAFFQRKILNADASKLSSESFFQEYFRGLYFKAEKSGGSATNMALLDFATKGRITIKYKAKTASTTDADETMEDKTLIINLKGNTVSLPKDIKKAEYAAAIDPANVNSIQGDARLYLKGGQGSLAVIELKDFAAKLEDVRAKKWLVNEANLVFHVDSDKMTGADEARRIYLYDLDNNVILADYVDGTSGALNKDPKSTRYIFDGMLNVDATTKRGKTYKIRLTNHVRNLIKDATAKNVRLGLVVTEDINMIASNKLKLKNTVISEVPRASVMSPLGTVLFGANIPAGDVNYDKRLKLEVYYTKPN